MQRREDKDGLEWTNLCYVRTNGNHWNGPIKQATACVEAGMLAQARLHRRAQRLLPAGIDTVALLPRTRHRCGPVPGASYSTSQVGILPASCLEFRLTIRKQAASAIPSVCLDGELKKPTR